MKLTLLVSLFRPKVIDVGVIKLFPNGDYGAKPLRKSRLNGYLAGAKSVMPMKDGFRRHDAGVSGST